MNRSSETRLTLTKYLTFVSSKSQKKRRKRAGLKNGSKETIAKNSTNLEK